MDMVRNGLAYAIGRTGGCGAMSGAVNRMKAPLFPIWSLRARGGGGVRVSRSGVPFCASFRHHCPGDAQTAAQRESHQ